MKLCIIFFALKLLLIFHLIFLTSIFIIWSASTPLVKRLISWPQQFHLNESPLWSFSISHSFVLCLEGTYRSYLSTRRKIFNNIFYILQNHQIFVVKIIFFIYYSFPGLSYHSVTTRSLRWYHISKSLFCEHHVMSYKIHGLPPSVTMKKAHKSIIIHIHGYFTPLKYRGIKKERRRRKQIFKTIKKRWSGEEEKMKKKCECHLLISNALSHDIYYFYTFYELVVE